MCPYVRYFLRMKFVKKLNNLYEIQQGNIFQKTPKPLNGITASLVYVRATSSLHVALEDAAFVACTDYMPDYMLPDHACIRSV